MSNTYGFDFLKSEHVLEDDGRPPVAQVDDNDELLEDGGVPDVLEGSDLFYQAQLKPDLEKQFDILAFLQAHRGSGGCLAPSVIYRKTGIDLQDPSNTNVANMLQHNPKVRVELVPDPENPVMVLPTYAYQAKYSSVVNASTLLAQINKMTGSGIAMRDLLDSYQTVADDIQTLIRGGDIIAISNTEDKDKILFPRGESFVVELDGLISLIPPPPKLTTEIPPNNQPEIKEGEEGSQQVKQEPYESQDSNNEQDSSSNNNTSTNQEDDTNKTDANSMPPPAAKEAKMEDEPEKPVEHFVVETDMDPRTQIRRGEAIQVGGQWFRVSSAVRAGVTLSEQPVRAQAPLSVVSLSDLSKKNEIDGYIRPLSSKTLPLDHKLSEEAQKNILDAKAARERLLKLTHGRTGGVAGQLLSSQAHASNPAMLAASLSGSSASSMMRKRPNTAMSSSTPTSSNATTAAGGGATTSVAPLVQNKEALKKAAADPALALYCHARRHGCTKDVRQMYLETRSLVPEADRDLHQLLIKHKLLEPGEQLRKPRAPKTGSNVDNDGKPKKRRYYERKNQRMTNTHLEGTEIGKVLALAAEKQRQGGAVGDGGM